MLKTQEEVIRWLRLQEEVVIRVSAYLLPIKEYLEQCQADASYASDMTGVHQLYTHAENWDASWLLQTLRKMNLEPYNSAFEDPRYRLVVHATSQTIPNRRVTNDAFLVHLRTDCSLLAELVIAFAKIPCPSFCANFAAGTPFDAYVLVSRLVEAATQRVCIVDAYLDETIFTRYLYRAGDGVQVSLCTYPDGWNRKGWRDRFEQAEKLFASQHVAYRRLNRNNLHARYLIVDDRGWWIDSSIKDIAVSKDCPIHTITSAEVDQVVADHFA